MPLYQHGLRWPFLRSLNYISIAFLLNPIPGGKGRKKTSSHVKSHCKLGFSFKISKKICNPSLLSKDYLVALSMQKCHHRVLFSYEVKENWIWKAIMPSTRSRPKNPKYRKNTHFGYNGRHQVRLNFQRPPSPSPPVSSLAKVSMPPQQNRLVTFCNFCLFKIA